MTHTPGPWVARYKASIHKQEYSIIHYDRAHNMQEQVICKRVLPAGQTDAQGNALLIAAAPDMLVACRALVEAYDRGGKNGGSVSWEDLDDAHAMARKAISNMKGK